MSVKKQNTTEVKEEEQQDLPDQAIDSNEKPQEVPQFNWDPQKEKPIFECGHPVRWSRRDFLVNVWNQQMATYVAAEMFVKLYESLEPNKVIDIQIQQRPTPDGRGYYNVERKLRAKDLLEQNKFTFVKQARKLKVIGDMLKEYDK